MNSRHISEQPEVDDGFIYSPVCAYCATGPENTEAGEFIKKYGISVHSHCLVRFLSLASFLFTCLTYNSLSIDIFWWFCPVEQ